MDESGLNSSQEDFTKLSLSDKLSHKAWKARSQGYEELAKLLSLLPEPEDPKYKQYLDLLKGISQDPNAVAIETGLGVISAFVSYSNLAAKARPLVLSNVVEKCLSASRTATRQKALELLLLFVEVDLCNYVIDELISFLDHKQPKLVSACISAMTEILHSFGNKVVDVKPILKIIPKIFGHADKNVRSEANRLTVEIYRWIGPTINSFIDPLSAIQKTQLADDFSKLPAGEKAKPTRLRRKDQDVPVVEEDASGDAAAATGAVEEEEPEAAAGVDAFELAEPVNVLGKIPADFYDLLASTKWKERKEALENFLVILRVPRIAEDRYGELVSALAKRLNDSNILISLAAANCIEALAKGLRKSFAMYRPIFMSNLLERLKEKKSNIVEGYRTCLDAVFDSTGMKELVEDVTSVANHKNPQVKLETFKWLARSLSTTRKGPEKTEVKALVDVCKSGLNDGFGEVRDAAAESLATLTKLVGERALAQLVADIDPIKMAKVKEFEDKVTVKAKKAAPAASAPAANSRKPSSASAIAKRPKSVATPKADIIDKENSPPQSTSAGSAIAKQKRPSSNASLATSLSLPAACKSNAKKNSNENLASSADQPISYKFDINSASSHVEEIYTAEIITQLSDSNWKVRLAAIEAIQLKIESGECDASTSIAEAHICFLCSKPGFKESNFQVIGKLIAIITFISSNWKSFDKASASLAIPSLVDKLGDIKQRKICSEALAIFAEKVGLSFVLAKSIEPIKGQKSPKIQADQVKWVQSTISEFGIKGINVRELVDFIKVLCSSSNALVRGNSISVLGTLRVFMGPDVRFLVQDLPAPLLASIDAEFAKVAEMAPPEPTRVQPTNASTELGGGKEEDLIPRVDIGNQLSGKVIQNLGNSNWKVRIEGLEEVVAILDSANRKIKPNLGDLPTELKNRLSDSNKNIAVQTMEIIGMIAKAMGKPFEKYVKQLLGTHIINCLSDNKAQVRGVTLKVMDTIAESCGAESLLPSFAACLVTDSPNLRKDGLKWLSTHLTSANALPATARNRSMTELVPCLLSCVMDRLPEIRKLALTCLEFVAEHVGIEHIKEKVMDLKTAASIKTVMPLIEGLNVKKSSSSVPASSSSAAVNVASNNSSNASINKASTLKSKGRVSSISSASSLKRASVSSLLSSTTDLNNSVEPANAGNSSTQTLALLTGVKGKESRAEKDKGMYKWNYEPDRKDLLELLKEQGEQVFSQALCSLLFCTDDFKEQISGLSFLEEQFNLASSVKNANNEIDQSNPLVNLVIGSLDVVLKYFSVRLYDSNTSVTLKVLDAFEALLTLLDGIDYHLLEYEASCILPHLVNRMGDAKEVVRQRTRLLLSKLSHVYPPSKIFPHLMNALTSKNAKTRAEALDEIAHVLERNNGLGIINSGGTSSSIGSSSAKIITTIGSHISDRDANVRNGALNALVQAYFIDEGIMSILKLSEKDASLLEERIKRTKKTSSNVTSSVKKGESSAVLKEKDNQLSVKANKGNNSVVSNNSVNSISANSVNANNSISSNSVNNNNAVVGAEAASFSGARPFSLDIDNLELPQLSRVAHTDPNQLITNINNVAKDNNGNSNNNTSTRPSTVYLMESSASHNSSTGNINASSSGNNNFMLDFLATQIVSDEASISIEALKQLTTLISSNEKALLLLGRGDSLQQIVHSVTLQLHLAFFKTNVVSNVEITRLRKHVVNALVQLFNVKELAEKVSNETLSMLLEEVLMLLLDERLNGSNGGAGDSSSPSVSSIESGPQLARALNVLMIRILENCNRNSTFSILLSKLNSTSSLLLKVGGNSASPSSLPFEAKLTELVMKCLWKMTKGLRELLNGNSGALKVDLLLKDIHIFLNAHPPADWKKRARPDSQIPLGDMPLKTVKTILHELVLALDRKVLDFVNFLDNSNNNSNNSSGSVVNTYVVSYLNYMLEAVSNKKIEESKNAPPPPSESESNKPNEVQVNVPPTQDSKSSNTADAPLSDDTLSALNNELTQIFAKIGSKDETRAGLLALYEILCVKYRDNVKVRELVENEHLLKNCGSFLQGYIKRGLNNIATERKQVMIPLLAGNSNNDSAPLSSSSTSAFAASGSNASGNPSLQGYKETLVKLQEMFNNTNNNGAESNNDSVLLKTSSSIANDAEGHLDQSTHAPSYTSSNSTGKDQPDNNSTAAEIDGGAAIKKREELDKLKERLAQLKNSNNSGGSSMTQ